MDDTTLPSPGDAALGLTPAPPRWTLVLAFHPQTDRIGECWSAPLDASLPINRRQPRLARPGAEARPLGDARIGRELLELRPDDDGWRLQRAPGRCHVRVDGAALRDSLWLPVERLQRGVVLLLAQTVLLHLRLDSASAPEAAAERPVPGLLGVGTAARRLRAALARAAGSGGDVLLLGPTGTGKEVAARAIHALGAAPGAPWVAVNMSVLSPELAAAELFGVRRGAYTGADRSRPGFFQQAAGGTLFLDEIGDAPATVQPLLLRALQERELQVVGGAVERVQLRVIAATEIDPLRAGSGFRAALRYRFRDGEIHLPPLEARREDIAVIAAHALRREARCGALHWPDERADGRELARWARCFEGLLLRQWPGNVRELLQLVRAIAQRGNGELVVPETLLPPGDTPGAAPPPRDSARKRPLAAVSDAELADLWVEEGGEITAIARRLGASRGALYRRRRGVPGCRLADEVPVVELRAVLARCDGDTAAAARCLVVSLPGLRARLRREHNAVDADGDGSRAGDAGSDGKS